MSPLFATEILYPFITNLRNNRLPTSNVSYRGILQLNNELYIQTNLAHQPSGNDEHFNGTANQYHRCHLFRTCRRGGIRSIGHTGIYYLALYMLGFGFSIGLQAIIARRNGEQNYQAIGKTFFQGLFFLSGLAAFLCLLIHLVTPFILQRLITSPEIYQAIIRYLDWRSFGLLFSFPFLAMRSFFVGITDTTALSWAALIAVLINIPFNYFLIFTLNLGITGAAIASSLAEMGSFLMLLTYLWKSIDKVKYGLKPIYSGKILIKVLKLSIWSMFHAFINIAP